MKRLRYIAGGLMLLASFGFMGCKKDGATSDPSASFKNTIWTGEFNNGDGAQPLSMEFKDGGAVTWYDLAGETSGTWKVENGMVTVAMSNGNGFKAGVSGDNKLTNIQSLAGSTAVMVHAELNNSTETTLDETTWTAPNVSLHFTGGSKVDMALGPTGSTKYPDITFVYKAKTIRFAVVNGDYRWFFVRSSSTAFKGINQFLPGATLYPFDMSKK
ncbi:hypothetical protein Q4E93_22830 [Flavitalea sp. BT771]|uniref:hypothetical protein n=1 Tax=Flavitalea sp. BT771 TaxID=3063329 RepID=UPI0026E2C65D|nr:hypothetical protein [Flavitalea sp. BT771]MDO6433466.1 hypothetical protein [Flavitalea sp. BT771]MDV6222629.1 hypothetical protein [Flavitalea sp. BT771]